MVSKNRCVKITMSFSEEDSAACTALKATKYKPAIKYLSSLAQQQSRVNSKICLLAFLLFNIAYYNYNCHSGISIVVYEVLLINIILHYLF
jgi:hypothetical protein